MMEIERNKSIKLGTLVTILITVMSTSNLAAVKQCDCAPEGVNRMSVIWLSFYTEMESGARKRQHVNPWLIFDT